MVSHCTPASEINGCITGQVIVLDVVSEVLRVPDVTPTATVRWDIL
jgi:hypothetical protein